VADVLDQDLPEEPLRQRLAQLVDLLWQTDEIRPGKPTVLDEASAVAYYLEQLGTHAVPDLLKDLETELARASFTLPPPRSSSDLPKSKSASHLHYHMGGAVNDWAYRTGAALTSETRESKGQSWLVSRESSTSLVGEGEEEARFYSVDAEEYGTPMWDREGESEDTWSGELEGDEEEVDLRQGFGLGQFIDRLVGWSLFVDESDEEGEEEEDAEELEGAKMGAEKNRLAERRQETGGDGSRNQYEEKDDWHDPSWIFDLASKIVF